MAFSLGICEFRRLSLCISKITLLSSSFNSLFSLQRLAIQLTSMISDAVVLNNSIKVHPNQQCRSFRSQFCPQCMDRFPMIFSPIIIFRVLYFDPPYHMAEVPHFSILNGSLWLFDLYPFKLLSLCYFGYLTVYSGTSRHSTSPKSSIQLSPL